MTGTNPQGHRVPLEVRTVTRTLTVAGFEITSMHRGVGVAVYACRRKDLFGIDVHYLVCFWEAGCPSIARMRPVIDQATRELRVLINVASAPCEGFLSWEDFLGALGGPVPTWRALSDNYPDIVRTAGANQLPAGFEGEAWRLFEDAIADGIEFMVGCRVKRLGGARRGQRVGDVLAMTPDDAIFVVDAKASGDGFHATGSALRPLREYVERQHVRQLGQSPVVGAVVIANEFRQDATALMATSAEFFRNARVGLLFVETDTLLGGIKLLRDAPGARAAVDWRGVFGRTGLLEESMVIGEVRAAITERMGRDRLPPAHEG